jgi:general stress protein 26
MSESVKQNVIDYLVNHIHLRLGTVTPEGGAHVTTVTYASDGTTVYFMTDKTSRKAVNLLNNPKVAYTVDEDCENIGAVQGVRMEGIAEPVSDEDELQKAMGLIIKKFPSVMELPPNPNMFAVKIIPTRGYFLDNSKGLGTRYDIDL